MTTTQFVDQLASHKGEFYFREGRFIRHTTTDYCPIETLGGYTWQNAALNLRLSNSEIFDIISAADNSFVHFCDNEHSTRRCALRKRLLDKLGLKETTLDNQPISG